MSVCVYVGLHVCVYPSVSVCVCVYACIFVCVAICKKPISNLNYCSYACHRVLWVEKLLVLKKLWKIYFNFEHTELS